MDAAMMQRFYFSLLRWRRDATRDEARNVAVILVDDQGTCGGIRYAPISRISRSLSEQGILDAMIQGLQQRFESDAKPSVRDLERMHETLRHSLHVTLPRTTAAPDPQSTLEALYRAYVQPTGRSRRGVTKGDVLDKSVEMLRKRGLSARRHEGIGSFKFDIVVSVAPDRRLAMEVLSFATPAKDPTPVEHDTGHFLYAIERVNVPGYAVIQPPTDLTTPEVSESYDRVLQWMADAEVPTIVPDLLKDVQLPVV